MASGHAPVQVPAPHVPGHRPTHARPAGFFLLPRLQKLEGGAQTFVSSSRKDTLTCTRPRVPPRASALSPTAMVPQQTFLRAQLVPRLNQRSPGLPLFKDSPGSTLSTLNIQNPAKCTRRTARRSPGGGEPRGPLSCPSLRADQGQHLTCCLEGQEGYPPRPGGSQGLPSPFPRRGNREGASTHTHTTTHKIIPDLTVQSRTRGHTLVTQTHSTHRGNDTTPHSHTQPRACNHTISHNPSQAQSLTRHTCRRQRTLRPLPHRTPSPASGLVTTPSPNCYPPNPCRVFTH